MRVLLVSEKSFEISQIRNYLQKLPFNEFDKEHRLDFYDANTGKSAVDRYESDSKKSLYFDLIIISQKMKGFTGLMTAQAITGKKGIPTPPMILMTEMMDKTAIEGGLKGGITGFLKIPYNLDEFKDTLTRMVDSLVQKEEKARLEAIDKAGKLGETKNITEFVDKTNKRSLLELEKFKMYAPWNNKPHLITAKLLMEGGDFKTPIPILRSAIKLDFTDKEPHKLLQACYHKTGMHKEELGSLKKLLASDPKSSKVNAKVGDALLREGNFQKAVEFFRKAIVNHKPGDPKAIKARSHMGLGKSLMKINEKEGAAEVHEEAKEHFTHAVKVDPTLVAAYFNLIAVYKKMGKEDEAREIMKKAVKITPSNADDWMDLFFFYLEDGETKKAKFALAKGLAMDPDNPLNLFLAGEAYVRQRMFQDAAEYLEKTAELYPSDIRTYNFLGICYRNLKQPQKSVENYRKALDIDPDDFNVQYNLGKALINNNDLQGAKAAFETAFKLNPELVEAQDAIAQVVKKMSGG